MKSYQVAVIPGDGIGVDVINAAWHVLVHSAAKFDFTLGGEWFP